MFSGVLSYHGLLKSIKDIIHDGETFSNFLINRFHRITHTTPADHIYKRTTSRDMNRMRRIIVSFDEAAKGPLPRSELVRARSQIIHDLAELARANPDSPDIAAILHALPTELIPKLPKSAAEAIAMDEIEHQHAEFTSETIQQFEQQPEPVEGEARPSRPRRRFHRRVTIINP